jgi:hypothetical protein
MPTTNSTSGAMRISRRSEPASRPPASAWSGGVSLPWATQHLRPRLACRGAAGGETPLQDWVGGSAAGLVHPSMPSVMKRP